MRIALNMVSANHGGGFNTYNSNILKGLLDENDRHQYFVFINEKSIKLFTIPKSGNIHVINISEKFSLRIAKHIWIQAIFPIYIYLHRINILFSPMNVMPIILKLFNIRTILVTHTNLPWLYPKDVPGGKLNILFLKLFMNLSIKVSDRVIVDSKTAKKELTEIFPNVARKTKTIYLGLDNSRFNKNNGNNLFLNDKIDIRKDNYFLSISASLRYHCLKELIIAYDNLNCNYDKFPKLLLISKNLDQKYYNEIMKFISTRNSLEKIILIEDINSDLIPSIYSNADIYIFSSYCEVFSLTNLEAMSCGVPVITANKSAMPEICGDAALYFNPHDPVDVANKISNLFFDEKLKEEMIIKGYKRASKYSWQNTCEQTKSLIFKPD